MRELKKFSWRVEDFDGEKMKLRVDFDNPNWITYMDND